ncbi:MAG TPA: hypothetical protein VGG01_04105 [Xanthobacteraceae bacterium]|jgi:hypothetical protein
MHIEPIGIATLVAGLLCLALGLRFATSAFAIATLLGDSAALTLPALGNANIQPAHLLLAFFVTAVSIRKTLFRRMLDGTRFPQPGFWLVMTVLFAIVSAYYFPRVFSGVTEVFGLRTDNGGHVVLTALAPSSGNLTQSIYLIGDLICFLAMSAYARSANGTRTIVQAILICAVANLAFAALDLATSATNTSVWLSFIRNATYRQLGDVDALGTKRIVGSFSEASAFGFATLGFFAFAMQLWLEGVYRRIALAIAMLSLVALIFSTSTTAYVGMSMFLALALIRCLTRMTAARATPQVIAFTLIVPLIIVGITALILINDQLGAYAHETVQTALFDKLTSTSGVERSAWNMQALVNFADTYGFGAGVGSLRASSLPIAVLGSMGVVGALLYGVFLGSLFWRNEATQPPLGPAVQRAARSACIALLIAAAFTSSLVDLGLPFIILAALASAEPDRNSPRAGLLAPRSA